MIEFELNVAISDTPLILQNDSFFHFQEFFSDWNSMYIQFELCPTLDFFNEKTLFTHSLYNKMIMENIDKKSKKKII